MVTRKTVDQIRVRETQKHHSSGFPRKENHIALCNTVSWWKKSVDALLQVQKPHCENTSPRHSIQKMTSIKGRSYHNEGTSLSQTFFCIFVYSLLYSVFHFPFFYLFYPSGNEQFYWKNIMWVSQLFKNPNYSSYPPCNFQSLWKACSRATDWTSTYKCITKSFAIRIQKKIFHWNSLLLLPRRN